MKKTSDAEVFMIRAIQSTVVSMMLILGIGLLHQGTGSAQEKRDMGGWGKNSPCNQLYKPTEMDSFKGVIVKITEVVPLPGMSPGVALLVRDRGNEIVTVHLGPKWFVGKVGIKKGDRVKVKGVWAEINGKDVFMASKVTKGDYFEFKVRLTKDGTPFWAMSKEALAKERAGK
jgi:hypothetical protein